MAPVGAPLSATWERAPCPCAAGKMGASWCLWPWPLGFPTWLCQGSGAGLASRSGSHSQKLPGVGVHTRVHTQPRAWPWFGINASGFTSQLCGLWLRRPGRLFTPLSLRLLRLPAQPDSPTAEMTPACRNAAQAGAAPHACGPLSQRETAYPRWLPSSPQSHTQLGTLQATRGFLQGSHGALASRGHLPGNPNACQAGPCFLETLRQTLCTRRKQGGLLSAFSA